MASQGECVLAVGSGSILTLLAKAWYESGLSKITIFVTNSHPTDIEELKGILEQARLTDQEASLHVLAATEDEDVDWAAAVRPFTFILYVSQHGYLEELWKLQAACIAEKKPLLPALGLRGVGMAGPLLHPDGDGCWESAWRRVHSAVFPTDWKPQAFPATAAAVLSNLILYECHKTVTGEQESNCRNQCYILDPLTLEGRWHPILPHPIVTRYQPIRAVEDLDLRLGIVHEPVDTGEWFSYFSRLTSVVSGIFHVWEEGSLNQLPLAQCLVQPADPLSEGPAPLLPAIVCSGLTHVEARLESGLAGLESYIARMTPLLVSKLPSYNQDNIRIGAGRTFAEAVGRGLCACLTQELDYRTLHQDQVVTHMECTRIEDIHCQFYLQALSILEGEPLIAVGAPLLGFPVVWVRSGIVWYGSVGLDITLALRQSLQKALMKTETSPVPSMIWNNHKRHSVIISSGHPIWHAPWMLSAVQSLKQYRKRLEVIDMQCESFLKEGPLEVFGVLVREEASP